MFYKIGFQPKHVSRALAITLMSTVLVACGGEETEAEASNGNVSIQDPQSQVTDESNTEVIVPVESDEQNGDTLADENPITQPIEYVPHQEDLVEEQAPEEPVEEVAEEVVEEVVVEEIVEEEVVVEAPVELASIELSWSIPSSREDGSDLELYEIDGYVVSYGTDSENLNNTVDIIGYGETSVVIDELESGTYYFAIATIDSEGVQGAFSEAIETEIL